MRKKKVKKRKSKKVVWTGLGLFTLIYIGVMLYHTFKPLPKGISYEGDTHYVDDIEMFTDLTFAENQDGENLQHELYIFDEVYALIDEAEEFIVMDLFLMDHYTNGESKFPKIADTITEKLIDKKTENPEMQIVFITDPINTGYESYESKWFTQLTELGVEVAYTDLDKLRDSIPLYSGLYRTLLRWTDIGGKGWVPNAMASDAPKFKLSSYAKLLNVKANHRKVVVTEQAGIVTSSNPHNASGFHGNVAMKVTGSIINDILEAEEAVFNYSTKQTGQTLPRIDAPKAEEGRYTVQYVTEQRIRDALLNDLKATKKGDRIRMGMFFLAQKEIVAALLEAAEREVDIQIIVDPNENSFGNEKSGLPNRPVAQKLTEDSDGAIQIRWYNTVVGQYHTKLVVTEYDNKMHILNGSANLTERTLDNYNLESDLYITAPLTSPLAMEIDEYFTRLWENEDAMYTLELKEYETVFTRPQRIIYSLQEWLKLTSY